MIKNFSIRNFRGFRSAEIDDLRRINIVVGANGSGKTAFGEAILLAATGGSFINWYLRPGRNRPNPANDKVWDRVSFENFWKDWFFDLKTDETIHLSFFDSEPDPHGRLIQVRIKYEQDEKYPATGAPSTAQPYPLAFYRDIQIGPDHFPTKHRIWSENGQLRWETVVDVIPTVNSVGSTTAFDPSLVVPWYSAIQDKKREGEFNHIIRGIFPEIKDVRLGNDGDQQTLVAIVDGINERIPITLVSSGMARLCFIILAIMNAQGGAVLVDEIENGLYYETMPRIWSCLLDACKVNRTQLFVGTHSWECLQSARPAVQANESDFTLIRTNRHSGETHLRKYDGEHLYAALDEKIEIR